MQLFIYAGIKVKPCLQKGPRDFKGSSQISRRLVAHDVDKSCHVIFEILYRVRQYKNGCHEGRGLP